jgi:hypothetical protein
MPTTVTIHDKNPSAELTHSFTLDFMTSHVTVRQLIRSRIYQEVEDYNVKKGKTFHGLVQPTDTDTSAKGFKMNKPREINWKTQFEKALEAFQRNGYHIFIDDKQVKRLDEEVDLKPGTQVSFVKLTPIVGG